MTSQFVLVGGPFEIRDTAFEGDQHLFRCTLGATFEMEDDLAHKAIVHGAALLPKEHFDEIGFTADELKRYPNARAQQAAPEEFHVKLKAARIAVHEFRAQLAAPQEV